jgi:FMS-like tyrosine kinase 1
LGNIRNGIQMVMTKVFGFETQPLLRDLNNGHTVIGNDIKLECEVTSNNDEVLIKWNVPLKFNLTLSRVNITTSATNTSTSYTFKSKFVLRDATLEDKSIYYCIVEDKKNTNTTKYEYIWVPVYEKDEFVLKFNKDRTFFDKSKVQIQASVAAHPKAEFIWRDKNNKLISTESSSKYVTQMQSSSTFANYEIFLKFINISYDDFGNYTVTAQNKFGKASFVIPVNLTGAPRTSVRVDNVDEMEMLSTIECKAIGYPQPTIKWYFFPCDVYSCLEKKSQQVTLEMKELSHAENGLETISSISVNSSISGFVQCVGANSFGKHDTVQHLMKIKNGLEIYTENIITSKNLSKVEVLYNETIDIFCAVSLRDYNQEITWHRAKENLRLDDPKIPVRGLSYHKIHNINAVYSSISRIQITINDKSDGDIYTCKAFDKNGTITTKSLKVVAKEQPYLIIESNMQNKSIDVQTGKKWKFHCNPEAFPSGVIRWFKNNVTITNSKRIQIENSNQTLSINDVQHKDNGTYECQVSNRLNHRKIKRAILVTRDYFDWSLLIVIVLILIFLPAAIFLTIKLKKAERLKKELNALGLENFEKGGLENINPELRLEDQVDLLPYDKKWEIPRENIKLGKELGSGAFGVVLKAEVVGLSDNKAFPAAVKMVNKFAGYNAIKALASELKIMVHIGKHINIVNVLGACTKDLTSKKLLVVVEYCPFGNLQEYILLNSKHFIDQRNVYTGQFDWKIGEELLKMSIKNNDNSKNIPSSINYIEIMGSKTDGGNSYQQPDPDNDEKREFQNNNEKKSTHICSKYFLIWAFQIARGMEYLASRRVLHGDLAARNVLLSEDNVVKISDFGLSKSMYSAGIYKKKTNVPLPIKWMAVESIGQQIFSTQSDIWSYGVVLWELFSLAKTPYPGMQVDQTFYNKLMQGYRMQSPEFATNEIYKIMLRCWNADPLRRPSFTEIADNIGLLLEDNVRKYYMDMNKCYILMNNHHTDEEDYLLMMKPPDFENTVASSPYYVNNMQYLMLSENGLELADE